MTAHVELTDTFGGEANYSWVRRESFPCDGMSNLAVVRKAKALVDLSGARGQSAKYGDSYDFRPYGMCVAMFIVWDSEE